MIMGFGANLESILKSKNMTVAELAKRTGISSSTLYAIIRRDSDNVNLSAVQKIANELKISVNELMPKSTTTNLAEIYAEILDFSGDYFDPDENIIDIHFTTEEFTPDEIAEIVQFADFLKQRRKKHLKKPPTTK